MQLIWADVVVGAVFVSLSALLVIVVVFLDIVLFGSLFVDDAGLLLLFFMILVVGYYEWGRFCFYGFGVPKFTVYCFLNLFFAKLSWFGEVGLGLHVLSLCVCVLEFLGVDCLWVWFWAWLPKFAVYSTFEIPLWLKCVCLILLCLCFCWWLVVGCCSL